MKAIHLPARIVIVGEAVGPSTLRFSGVNYFDQYGRLGPTGIRLDRMLVPFGYTIYPPCDIKVPKGMIDCIRGGGRHTVYCTDLCPAFPGYENTKRGDTRIRRPSRELIRSALEQRFLFNELEVLKPRVIFLLGEHSYRSFYRHFLNTIAQQNLSALVYDMKNACLQTYRGAVVVPLLHPSPASPSFAKWFSSFPTSPSGKRFVNRVKPYLEN